MQQGLALADGVSHAEDPGQHQDREGAVDIGAWFDQHGAFLLRMVQRLTGLNSQVEDVVQDVFLIAHRRRHEIPPEINIRGWLYRVAVNLVRHQKRSFARRLALQERLTTQDAVAPATTPEEDAQRQQQALLVRQCVARLPLKQREVFVLFELEGIEGQQVAQLLDIPENTVWSRLHHGRKRFRALWQQQSRQA